MGEFARPPGVQYYAEKIESLGLKKMELTKQLGVLNESDTNVISISEAKKNLHERTEAVTRGWSKLPDSQKRRALRRLIKDVLIGPDGMDIYDFYNSLAEEGSLGVLAVESGSPAKVLAFRGPRNRSKLMVENCLLSGMVTPAGLEPATPILEGWCSIQLSYGVAGSLDTAPARTVQEQFKASYGT